MLQNRKEHFYRRTLIDHKKLLKFKHSQELKDKEIQLFNHLNAELLLLNQLS